MSRRKFGFFALAVIGLLSSLLSFWILKEIRTDIAALEVAIDSQPGCNFGHDGHGRFDLDRDAVNTKKICFGWLQSDTIPAGHVGCCTVGAAMKLRVLRWISSCCVPLAAVAILSFLIHESLAQTTGPVVAGAVVPGTVQLPTFHFFTNTGTVVVPDGGNAFLGGVSSSAAGQVDRGGSGIAQSAVHEQRDWLVDSGGQCERQRADSRF